MNAARTIGGANRKDLLASAIFALISAFFGYQSLTTLNIGSATRMGPGFFPLALAIILLLISLALAFNATRTKDEPIGPMPWQAIVLVAVAPIVFGLTIKGLGFLPATILCVIASIVAGERKSMLVNAILVLCITAFCAAVFYYGLGIQVRLIGPWLGA